MELSDKAVICSCANFIRLKIGSPVPKLEEGKLKEGILYLLERETCISKKLYSTGIYEEGSVLDMDSIEDCSYRKSSN